MFLSTLWQQPDFYLSWVILVTFSICVHEASHAWAAAWRGDLTAARLGFLTLNPLKVMGLPSLVMLLVFGLAWGAVPVDRRHLRGRFDPALVAFSGPAANLLLALAFAVLAGAILALGAGSTPLGSDVQNSIATFAVTGLRANLFLFILNLLPLPILDGWEVAAAFCPGLHGLRNRLGGGLSLLLLVLVFMSPAGALLWRMVDRLAAIGLGGILALLRPLLGG